MADKSHFKVMVVDDAKTNVDILVELLLIGNTLLKKTLIGETLSSGGLRCLA